MQIPFAKESEMPRLQHFAAKSLQNLPLSPGTKIRAHNLRYVVEVECACFACSIKVVPRNSFRPFY